MKSYSLAKRGGELRGHGSLLEHVEERRQPVEVLADAFVVFVTGNVAVTTSRPPSTDPGP